MGFEVIIAATGKGKLLLQEHFKKIQVVDIVSYNIRYSKHKYLLAFKLLMQVPKILNVIRQEHKWLQKFVENEKIDLVISDNRYGLYTQKVPCIFITHQLLIKVPNTWLEALLQKINYRYINKFSACWVPDYTNYDQSIAGKLSHPRKLPNIPVHYLGLLNRFLHAASSFNNNKQYEYCFLISGPEPQRTLFEKKVLSVLPHLNGKAVVVLGKPGENCSYVLGNAVVYNHLPPQQLQQIIQASALVVCRSGYTTIMELVSLQKKMLLIPTPGQTEQEYLAGYLHEKNFCYSTSQKKFSVKDCFNAYAKTYEGINTTHLSSLYQTVAASLQQINVGQ